MLLIFALTLIGFNTLLIIAACARSSQLTWQESIVIAVDADESAM